MMRNIGWILIGLGVSELTFDVLSEGTCPPEQCVVKTIDDIPACKDSLAAFPNCSITVTANDVHAKDSMCSDTTTIQGHRLEGFDLDQLFFQYGNTGTGCEYDYYETLGGNNSDDVPVCNLDELPTVLYSTGTPVLRGPLNPRAAVETSIKMTDRMPTMDGYSITYWRDGGFECTHDSLEGFTITSSMVFGGVPAEPGTTSNAEDTGADTGPTTGPNTESEATGTETEPQTGPVGPTTSSEGTTAAVALCNLAVMAIIAGVTAA